MSKNDITGDEIKSKSLSREGRENYDKIFRKQSAYDWCEELYGDRNIILDPDGFRWNDGITMETKINIAEFQKRFQHCTISLKNCLTKK